MRRGAIVDQIKRLEHQADQVTHDVVTRLDRVFITPLDREDIHLLASRLDDVIDLIDGTARRLQIFHAGEAPHGAMLIADVIVRATEQLQVAVDGAGEEQGRDGARRLRPGEAAGGGGRLALPRVARPAVRGRSPTPLTVIKWKEIYDNLEKTLDPIEDAGNVLESISIKHA